MTTTVNYPARAVRALGFLKRVNNDIEIYVEDTATPNLWLKLLRKYLPNQVKLNSVNVVGDKRRVIKACARDQERDGRRRLYIVDGDLELLLGKRRPNLRYLYRLRSYCVENYILDERAFISAVAVLVPTVNEADARTTLDFGGWFDRNSRALASLFVCYAVVKQLKNEERTVRYPIYRMLKGDESEFDLCEVSVARRVRRLYRSVREDCTKDEVRVVFDGVKSRAKGLKVRRFVSGKDYLFPAMYERAKRKFSCNMSQNSFKVLIAECVVESTDGYLRGRLRRMFS